MLYNARTVGQKRKCTWRPVDIYAYCLMNIVNNDKNFSTSI